MANSVVLSNYKGTLILNDRSITESEAVAKHNVDETAHQYIQGRIDQVQTALSGKQDTIADLETIRSGAAAGATAVQPGSLATVATSGSYTDLLNQPTIPTVNDATLTIQKNGTDIATFTANSSSNATANITVPTQASDIGAQPTLVSGTNIKTVNNTSLLGSGDITIDSLPSQTGNSGKFLTTDGSSASWATIPSSVTTQHWYTGNTGSTLDVSSLTGNVVKVYKNGILLEEGALTKTCPVYTAPSDGTKQLILTPGGSGSIPFSTYDSWSFELKMYFNTTSTGSLPGVFFVPITAGYDPVFVAGYGSRWPATIWAQSGTGWLIEHAQSTFKMEDYGNSTFFLKTEFTGGAYNIYYKFGDSGMYISCLTQTKTAKLNDGDQGIGIFNWSDTFWNASTVYMKDVKFIANGVTLFDGKSAVKGTDYVVDAAWTETTETVAADNTYSISSGIITFSNPLMSSDKVMVETK